MTDIKPAIRSELQLEELVIAALRRLGGIATSHQIWTLIDAAFDVSFEIRRLIFDSLIVRGKMRVEEVLDHRLPEPRRVLYVLATRTESPKGGTDAGHHR